MEKLKSFPEGTVVYSVNDFHLNNGSIVFNFPTCSLAQLTRTNSSGWGYVSIFKSKGLDKAVRYIDSEPAYFFDTLPEELRQDGVVAKEPSVTRTSLVRQNEVIMNQPSMTRTTLRTTRTQHESPIVAADSRTYVSTPKTVSFTDPIPEQQMPRTVDRKQHVPTNTYGARTSIRTIPSSSISRTEDVSFTNRSFPNGSLRTVPVQTVGRTFQADFDTRRQVTTDLIQRHKPICSEIYYSRFSVENPDDFIPVCQYAVNINELKDYLNNLNIAESIKYLRIMTREQEIGLVQTFMPTVDWFYASS